VGSSGKKEAVAVVEDLARELLCFFQGIGEAGRNDARKAAGLCHRVEIVEAQPGVVRRSRVASGGDRDSGMRISHMRSGMGMPRRPATKVVCRTKRSTTRTRTARRSSVSARKTLCAEFW